MIQGMKKAGAKTKSLKFIVSMSFGALTLVIVLNSVMGLIAERISSNTYLRVINGVDYFADVVLQAESQLLNTMYLLREFSDKKEEAVFDESQESLLDVKNFVTELSTLTSAENNDVLATIKQVETEVKAFDGLLTQYHQQTVETGLNEDLGLQGQFRTAAHKVEELFNTVNRDDLTVKYLMLRRHEKDFMLRLDEKYIDRATDIIAELQLDIDNLPLIDSEKEAAKGLLDTYEQSFLRLTALMLRNTQLLENMDLLIRNLLPVMAELVEESDSQVIASLESAEDSRVLMTAILTSLVAISVVCSIVLAIIIVRRLSIPLKAILGVTDNMAEGRLDNRANLTRMDEMGQIGDNLDRAGETLAELVHTIQTAVEEGSSLSDRLGSLAEETAAAIVEVSANIESIDKRTDDMNTTARDAGSEVAVIVDRLEDLGNSAGEQASSVTQSTASIEEMVASIKNVNEIAEDKNRAAEQLSLIADESRESVKQTGELVDEITHLTESTRDAIVVINAVASRTNLLAMNAAIEAAHAGDAGRGFSVVADEIRKLAESTGQNAKSINESLGAMVSKIELVRDASQTSISAMEKMSADVRGFTQSFAEISSSMSEMTIGSKEVLNASESLSMLTQNLNRAIAEMKSKSSGIAQSMDSVMNLAGQVSDGVSEIGRASTEINSAATSLSRDGDDNRTLMNRLKTLSDKFIVGGEQG